MAKKHFLVPSWLVNNLPLVRKLVWMTEAIVVWSLVGLIRLLPLQGAYRICNTLLRGLKPMLPFTSRILRNLSIAFPDLSAHQLERLASAVCGNLGSAMVDLVLAGRIWAERDRRFEFVTEEGLDLTSYRGRPVVMVVAHIGAWQLGLFVAAQYDLKLTSVYAPEENPYLRGLLMRLRSKIPVRWVSRDGCMRQLTKELRKGHAVGYATDTRSGSSELVEFFGMTMAANSSAARLALNNQCDLIPVRVERLPGARFRVTACRPIRPADPGAQSRDEPRQMTAELFRHFEAWIKGDPAQWICFSRFWPREAYEN